MSVPGPATSKLRLSAGSLDANISRKLSKFIVTDMYTNASSDRIYLAFELKRLSGPFWMSLFIPSICLVFAAEIILFIDEKHFEAMIMVALTSNLVMYTLYSSILEKMPEDSTLKLIDVWLLHGLLMPMLVFVVLVTNELLNNKGKNVKTLRTGSKVANSTIPVASKIRSCTEKDSLTNNGRNSMKICKLLIPATSVLFIIIFFLICLVNNYKSI